MSKTDHSSLGTTTVFDAVTLLQGPTQRFVATRFNGHDIGCDCPNGERCHDSGDDIGGGHRPVQRKNVDEGARAASITVGLSGGSPERFVRGGERARSASIR